MAHPAMNTPSIQYVRPTALLYLALPSVERRLDFGGHEERTVMCAPLQSISELGLRGARYSGDGRAPRQQQHNTLTMPMPWPEGVSSSKVVAHTTKP